MRSQGDYIVDIRGATLRVADVSDLAVAVSAACVGLRTPDAHGIDDAAARRNDAALVATRIATARCRETHVLSPETHVRRTEIHGFWLKTHVRRSNTQGFWLETHVRRSETHGSGLETHVPASETHVSCSGTHGFGSGSPVPACIAHVFRCNSHVFRLSLHGFRSRSAQSCPDVPMSGHLPHCRRASACMRAAQSIHPPQLSRNRVTPAHTPCVKRGRSATHIAGSHAKSPPPGMRSTVFR